MGASGMAPLHNDTAGDFCDKIENRPVTELIQEGLDSRNYDEVRAAAWLLRQLYDVFPLENRKKVACLANRRLSDILEDDVWMRRWNHPDAMRATVAGEVVWFGSTLGRAHQYSREVAEKLAQSS